MPIPKSSSGRNLEIPLSLCFPSITLNFNYKLSNIYRANKYLSNRADALPEICIKKPVDKNLHRIDWGSRSIVIKLYKLNVLTFTNSLIWSVDGFSLVLSISLLNFSNVFSGESFKDMSTNVFESVKMCAICTVCRSGP